MRKLAIAIIILLVLGGGYWIIQKNQTTSSEVTIHMGSFSRAIDYAPYLVAKNKGWFEEGVKQYNAKISYTEFSSLPPINEALATNNLDVIFAAEPPVVIGNAAGVDVKIKAVGATLPQEVLVHTDSPIQSFKDLKGKKIAALSGTSAHYGTNKNLVESGVSASDVQIIDMVPPDAKAAFESNQVDAWAVWPPFLEQEEISGKGRILPGSNVNIQSVVGMRGKFTTDHPELTQALLETVKRAQKWVVENPQDAQAIVAKELDLETAVVAKAWSKHNFQPALDDKAIADIQAKADFLYDLHLIKNKINVAADLIAK